ncbi:MAG: YtxH domain-containing protein [Chloroflexota bacterium]
MANDRASSFLIGLALGSSLGAAIAVILAPQPGEDTRLGLVTRGIELKRQAGGVVGQVVERGRVAVEEQRSRFQQAVVEGREASARTRSELLDRYEQAKEQGKM